MVNNKIYILSTRPVGETARAKALQHDIIIEEKSFIETQETVDTYKAKKIKELLHQNLQVVFTSMNAVEAVGKMVSEKNDWKIFCIGNTTRKLVKEIFGEKNIAGTADNASALADSIIKTSTKNIVFFSGDQRRDELPEKLKKNHIKVEEIVVYKTIQTPELLSKSYDAILFFSPSAVLSFFSENAINNNTQIFAIGSTTAHAAEPYTTKPVIIAEKPGKENLVNLAIKHYSKSPIL
ncbi:MAG: uroporphyrinogen-III synthase [Bacteroidota bacterium]|nr:uroporphyrinogen-III synthase [Bacteroidota bacterium]